MVEAGYTLCWAAKWHEEKEIFFSSAQNGSKPMLKKMWMLLNQADVVVHFNGKKFDIPTLQGEFFLHHITPPAPYKQVDILKAARLQFRFPSNKLDYLTRVSGIGGKVKHKGMQLWKDCMAGDQKAWKKMKQYNIGDVLLLEKLYVRMLPWIPQHPNRLLYGGSGACPKCKSKRVQSRGQQVNRTYLYKRYVCIGCGSWLQGERITREDKMYLTAI